VASIPGWGGDCLPPIKIYLGESIFSPRQSFSWTAKKLHQECTTNRHFEIQNQKKILGRGHTPPPPCLWRLDRPQKYLWIDAAALPHVANPFPPLVSTSSHSRLNSVNITSHSRYYYHYGRIFAFIRRCIRTGFCSPDLADFRDLCYIFRMRNYLTKSQFAEAISYGHSCHHLLHKITVLEIDLTTDSYLTAFLE